MLELDMTKKATKNGAKKVVLAILAEMPEDAKEAIMRPDDYGQDEILEFRVQEDMGAFVEMEVDDARAEGMQFSMTEKEARAATKLLGTSFVTRKQAAAIRRILAGEAES